MGRLLTLMLLLGVSLGVAKKKIEHNWQTGMLVRIVPEGETRIPEIEDRGHSGIWQIGGGASGLMFQGTDEGQDGFWLAVLEPKKREPNVHVGKQYKYAVEMVRCMVWDECGFKTSRDEFGRVHQTRIRPVLYLQDDDGRESKLEKAEFHRLVSPIGSPRP